MGHKMIVNMLNIVFRLLATWEQVNFISSSDDVIENYKKIMAVLSIFEKKRRNLEDLYYLISSYYKHAGNHSVVLV